MILRFPQDKFLRRALPLLIVISLLLQPLGVLAQNTGGFPNLGELAFIGVSVQLSGNVPELYLTNLPETCRTNAGETKLVVTASFDSTDRVHQVDFSQLQRAVNSDGLVYSFNRETPSRYGDGWLRFALSQPIPGCAAPSAINFRPELPPPANDFQSEFGSVDFQTTGSFGETIKGFVFSTVVNSLLDTISGKVPVGDSGVTKAIGNSIAQNFKDSLNALKQDLILSLRQAAATIAQQIFATVSNKLMQQFSKLAIKDPSLHKLLNTLGGVYLGVQSFQRQGCIDPAAIACYQAAVTNAVNGVKAQSGNARARTNADLILAASLRGMRRCPTSKIDSILGSGRAVPIPGVVSMSGLFGKLPFFAQALEASRARQPLTAQVGGFVSSRRNVPTGDFVSAGLANIATAQMCGDITARLSGSINLAVNQQLEKIQGELANGIQGVKRCKKWIGGISPTTGVGGFPADQTTCVEWEEVTPSGVVKDAASKLAQAPIEVATQQIASTQQQETVRFVADFIKRFINDKTLKVSQILLTQKGLAYGSEVAESTNAELARQSTADSVRQACQSQGSFDSQAQRACEDARKRQAEVAANYLSATEIHALQERYRQVVIRLRNVRAEFTRLNEASADPQQDQLIDRTRTEVETNADRLAEAGRGDLVVVFFGPTLDGAPSLDRQYGDLSADFAAALGRLTGITPSNELGEALDQYQNLQNPTTPDRQALATIQNQIRALESELQTERAAIQASAQAINGSINTFQSIAFSGGFGGQRPSLTSATDRTDNLALYPALFLGTITLGAAPQPNPQLAAELSGGNLSSHYVDFCLQRRFNNSCSQNFSARERFHNDLFYLAIRQPLLAQSSLRPNSLLQSVVELLQIASDEQRPATTGQLQGLTTIRPYLQQAASAIEAAQQYGAGQGWTAEPLTLSIPNFSANVNVDPGTILEVAAALRAAHDATNRTLALQTKLTELRSLQTQAQQTQSSYDNRLSGAYDRLVAELDPDNLNLDATNLSIKEIEDAVNELETVVPVFAERLLGFRVDFAFALSELPSPSQEPPTEEPPSSTAPASFSQRLIGFIRAPFRFGQQLAADVVGLIQSRRVKLK